MPKDTVNSISAVNTGSVISKSQIEDRGAGTEEKGDTYDPNRLLASEVRTFFSSLMFLTRLPCGSLADHHPTFLMRSMAYFPVIGLIVGAWGAVWYNAAAVMFDPYTAAIVSTMSTVWLTGCFHEDGLADTIDGFGGGWAPREILAIMKDSRVGTYALVGSILAQHLKLMCLTMLPNPVAALMLAHCASRWVPLPVQHFSVYIQDEEDAKKGLYNWFARSQHLLTPFRIALSTVFTAAVAVWASDACTACVIMAVLGIFAAGAVQYAQRVIKGIVGDYLGACVASSEITIYMLLRLNVCMEYRQLLSDEVLGAVLLLAAMVSSVALYCTLLDSRP